MCGSLNGNECLELTGDGCELNNNLASGSENSSGRPCPSMLSGSFTNNNEDCPVPAGTSTISTLELTNLRKEDSIGAGMCGGCPDLRPGTEVNND